MSSSSVMREAKKCVPFCTIWQGIKKIILDRIRDKRRKRKTERQGIIANRYQVLERIGFGAEGEVYAAIDMISNEAVAVKMVYGSEGYERLKKEYRIYLALRENNGATDGLTYVHYLGKQGDKFVMVMERHAACLEGMCQKVGGLSVRLVLSIGIQAIQRIEHMHKKGYIHGDVKPENMMIGLGKQDTLYMVDYGLSGRWVDDETGEHIGYSKVEKFMGTRLFSSLNADLCIKQTRRDDLESIGLVLVYLFKGKLPWSDLEMDEYLQEQGVGMHEMIDRVKRRVSLEELCSGMPIEFLEYLRYVRGLEFEEKPDYMTLIRLFKQAWEVAL